MAAPHSTLPHAPGNAALESDQESALAGASGGPDAGVATQTADRYSPSWVDRLTQGVDRLPGPPWLYYLCGTVLVYLLYTASKWWDGTLAPGTFSKVAAIITVSMVYYLGLVHYLDRVAKTAMDRFRPTADASEETLAALEYRLTTMPARPVWLVTMVGVVYGAAVLVAAWRGLLYVPAGPLLTSGVASFLEAMAVIGLTVNLLVFVYHTIHQLRTVNMIYAKYTRIDLFNLEPLHAFSRLTAWTAIGVMLLQLAWRLGEAWMTADLLTLLTGIGIALLASLAFLLPLLGIHAQVVEEKGRLQATAGQQLKTCIDQFNLSVDQGELDRYDPLSKALQTAKLEQEVVDNIPTWPWQPATLRGVASAVMLPVFLWFVMRLLERFITL